MDEEVRLHKNVTWNEYKDLVEQGALEENVIYFVTDADNYKDLVNTLIKEMEELKNRVEELTEAIQSLQEEVGN